MLPHDHRKTPSFSPRTILWDKTEIKGRYNFAWKYVVGKFKHDYLLCTYK